MRKLFVLFILFSMSLALQQLGLLSDTHNSVLLAIGMVILSAYTLSEVGSSLKLPRVTGYILTGLLLGPYVLKILSAGVVKEIEMVNTLAIGLIAITAGLELHFSSLKKVILPILTTSALKIVMLALSFAGSIYVANQYIYDFGMGTGLPLFALAMVFAALALGTSPSISIAVISEMNAKSRMSQMILGSAIVKDVIVVVTLAIVISFAKSVGSSAGDTSGGFLHLIQELGLSLFAGIVLGGIFITYIRFVRQEMFLFIAAMILVTAELSHAIHLELLLVFIVAGIVVKNFSKGDKILHDALEKVSLPVFVVFFTNVGAGLNLETTWQFLPVAGLFFVVRALSFYGSSYIAGQWHNESSSIQKRIWLGYLPQAGVTLGLISIASNGLPEHADLITNIGIGLVTLNLLLGPVVLRLVLKSEEPDAVVETPENDSTEEMEISQPTQTSELKAAKDFSEFDFEKLVEERSQTLNDSVIRHHFTEISLQIHEIFRKHQFLPQKNILTNFVSELSDLSDLSEQAIVAKIDHHFLKMSEKGSDIFNAVTLLKKEIDHTLVIQRRPLPNNAIKLQKSDSLWIKLRKIGKSPYHWFSKNPEREVPLRKLAKFNLEPFLGSFTTQLIDSWYQLLGKHIESFQKSLENQTFGTGDILEQIEKENQIWVQTVQSDFNREFLRVTKRWIRQLNEVNTVYLADSQIRYSDVEPQITNNFDKAKKDSQIWAEKFVFCRNRLKVIVQSALLSKAVESLLSDKFFEPIQNAQNNADQLVADVFEFFGKIEEQVQKQGDEDQELYSRLLVDTKTFTENHLQAGIKTKYVRGSFRLLNRDISNNLKRSLPREDGNFQVASEQTPPHRVQHPSEILVKKVNLYELYEQSILINFLPVIEEKIEGVSNYLESLLLEMEQAFSIINYNLDSQIQGEKELSQTELTESLLTSITAEKEKISELHQGLTDYVKAANSTAEKLLEECQQEVKQGIERFSVVSTAKNQFRQKLYNVVQTIKDYKNWADDWVDQQYQKVKGLAFHKSERDIDRALAKKIISKTLDTTTVRQYINETFQIDNEIKQLPRVYFRLFSLDPIQDKRFFVAHQRKWHHFEPFSKEEGFTQSQKILIIGDRGMGKSSLINVAQMDIKSDRLIRLEAEDNKTPLQSLARHFQCKPSVPSVLSALRSQSTTIIIDNVDQMLSKKRLTQFEALFDLIKQSPHQSHWILSITKYNLEALDKAYKIRSLFKKMIDLNEIHLETCREIILGRHRLSGLEINYPKTLTSEWAMKVGLSSEDEMFFRVLFERSHGHIRHLIYLWLLSLESSDGKSIQLSMSKTIERGLPMIHEFSTLQKYLLAELYSYHQVSLQTLSDNLGVSYSIIDNETQYLDHCGLIATRGIDRTVFEIPTHLVQPVGLELKKEGVLYEGINQLRI